MAAKFNTHMLCYGENVSFEYGGVGDVETYSAMDQVNNGVAVGVDMSELVGDGVTEKDLSLTLAPDAEELKKAFYAVAEKMYAQANPQGAPGADMGAQGGAQTGPSGETVYDADYKVVDDEDKK